VTDKIPESFNKKIEEIKKKYPSAKSAVMPALYLAQEHFGFISHEAIEWVSKVIEMPPIQVREVATFYSMYYKKPIGKYHFQVCRTLSCAVRGARELTQKLADTFHVDPHEVTPDGMFSYEEVECLGSCGTAPMCQINDRYFENLDGEKLFSLIEKIKKEKPELWLSAVNDSLGEGLSEYPKSKVV